MNAGTRKVALVTGASTGIGLATARRLLESGVFVVLTARDSSLERLQCADFLQDPSQYWLRPLDVRNALERRELLDEIEKQLGRLDYLINNAGVIYRTPIEYAYEFESKEQMLVNFHAPLEMVKVCLPLLRKSGGGRVIMVSSAAGFFSVPTMGLYAASKHALEGASEALYHELKPWNIGVTLIEPGFIASEAYMNCRLGLAFDKQNNPTAQNYRLQSRVISTLVDRAIHMTTSTPDQVAGAICRALNMKRPPLRLQVTLDAQVFAFLKRFLPSRAFDRLIGFCLDRIRYQLEHADFEVPTPAQV
ncbi:MAG: SDR family NAD(P)-dependent oxidoreductase [Bdellovibrionales bacterium]|nr:SDR family NAD(P)-dependent oxidoreductase [Bdellovibrionales bacterium]